jgi:cleavage stimulation factor subunit 2
MKRIYVGNLATGTDASALETLFEKYGHVSKAGIVCNRDTGEPGGFGFVLMRNDRMGDNAIKGLNGHNLNGQNIHVLDAAPPQPSRNPKAAPDHLHDALDLFRAY